MTVLSPLQVAAAAYAGRFRAGIKSADGIDELEEAVAIAHAESSWNTDAQNPCCKGLWQINVNAHGDFNWRDPVQNAIKANLIYTGAGRTFRKDWSQTYNNSNYKRALPTAHMAVAQLRAELAKNSSNPDATIKRILGNTTSTDPNVGNPQSLAQQVEGSVTNIPGIRELGQFFNALSQGSTWIRVAEGALGVLLVGLGIAAITRGTPIGSAIRSTPVGKIAKVVK